MSYLHTGFQKAVVFILLFFIVIPADAGRNDLHMRTFKKAFAAAGDKNYEEAIALYSEILEQNPYHVDALTQLGICYVHTNQELDSALTLFHKAMSIIPATDRFSPFGVDLQQTIARTYHLNQQPRELCRCSKVFVIQWTMSS
ncbi:tetratricopeptide repeat protein [Marinilabilia salmonicolor]|uniref:tetratricopeptide repeat protein n=1 Tax=Marinilabilia salmonicolor TaxID=989 RepID=UPI00131F3910|nr:tetratricopeptide repeat protein [Marinilabilia salmonicolor]